MDFFSAQDKARKETIKLIGLFCLAVICTVLVIFVLVSLAIHYAGTYQQTRGSYQAYEQTVNAVRIWDPSVFFWVTVIVTGVIVGSSLFHIASLSQGGFVVAKMLGGNLVRFDTTDPAERRLLNIVEEMSIASGVSIPDVYLLPDDSINAFAAGYSSDNAVIGVTRGSMEKLTRDELQGVIAHEFSHILNGDMRMNIRIMGVIFGLLVISMIGSTILRNIRVRSGGSNKNNGALVILLIGVILWIVGYIAMLFGRMIQAAISRQREYLADASAVQFTRNNEGLANALRKIGSVGSEISSSRAMEASHLFFSSGLDSIFATHPPLGERIRAIYPAWDGSFLNIKKQNFAETEKQRTAKKQEEKARQDMARTTAMVGGILSSIGNIPDGNIDQASSLMDRIPSALKQSLHSEIETKSLLCALLLDSDDKQRTKQIALLRNMQLIDLSKETENIYPQIQSLETKSLLPLIDLCAATLRNTFNKTAFDRFMSVLNMLAYNDQRLSSKELILLLLIRHKLGSRFENNKLFSKPLPLKSLSEATSNLLSLVARVSALNEKETSDLFAQWSDQDVMPPLTYTVQENENWQGLDSQLESLRKVAESELKVLLDCIVQIAKQDKTITDDEEACIRAISLLLGLPTPPLFENR